jgi:hypothetical protein
MHQRQVPIDDFGRPDDILAQGSSTAGVTLDRQNRNCEAEAGKKSFLVFCSRDVKGEWNPIYNYRPIVESRIVRKRNVGHNENVPWAKGESKDTDGRTGRRFGITLIPCD